MITLCKCHTGKSLFRGKGCQSKSTHISLLLLQDDVTALMIAVYHGHLHIVEVLTRFKPYVNLQAKVGVVTYCIVQSGRNTLEIVGAQIVFVCVSMHLVRGSGHTPHPQDIYIKAIFGLDATRILARVSAFETRCSPCYMAVVRIYFQSLVVTC